MTLSTSASSSSRLGLNLHLNLSSAAHPRDAVHLLIVLVQGRDRERQRQALGGFGRLAALQEVRRHRALRAPRTVLQPQKFQHPQHELGVPVAVMIWQGAVAFKHGKQVSMANDPVLTSMQSLLIDA